ncbi:aldehyde dehydrogenase family protein [Hoeflea prorocentri]|uniref:Aldehyde dehydrogenase family protein n=1 Tax=Hoeflea prorocentri TaxID=1922333 RepID=A0A9X3ZJP8_9HYPH|nr:aldehyde dehydrogenase family protein [Hoeflea prorocentri]MCY6383206.1 aldehyde dehydrogenase family protein [Hoeflea prorocentri]MDA5401006.1 aldehyde dehydrogenase family protein [Hoeflea prorocentri]
MADSRPYWQNYINGAFVDGGAGRLAVNDPATGDTIAEQALADVYDIDRAVGAARQCHESGALSDLRPVERGRMVRAMGDHLLERIDEIAPVLTKESGKPLWEARLEIEGAARYFEYYGNQAETVEGRSIPLGAGYFDFTVHEPLGVSAQIIPWNYPLEMTARSLSAALATGNACIVKPPELDPLTNGFMAQAAEAAGFPAGAVNIVCGHGKEAGAALAAHPDINQVVFTGSVPTGISIARSAAENIVPCVLELGGKSAAIVHDDADIDAFMDDVRWGIYFNAGQVCSAMSRVIAHRSIARRLTEAIVVLADSISVGDGMNRADFGPNMGAMISERQRERAVGMCADAERQGATLATGGHALNRPGYFMQPTVITDVSPEMDIARNEVFGPVLSILEFSDDDEAIAIANNTPYGLVGGVFTADLDRATRAAAGLRAGQVFVNEWYAGGVETPFGGYGKSGYGREKGRESLWNYVQTKNIAIRLKGNG